jgi:hypothetical protein
VPQGQVAHSDFDSAQITVKDGGYNVLCEQTVVL